jgi:uncharacterized protein (TIGR02680 family)
MTVDNREFDSELGAEAGLPVPARARWQPLRAGLVDIFYYDIEEFRFHDGRLLLRGNNGTGKSKVLALTLPFLLDGELTASRVEPDGDRNKRMEWNLLLGDKHPNPERTGYTWLEFGRVAEDGSFQYRTLGCGLKAVRGRGIADHWFFVTDKRVGASLPLLTETRIPFTRKRLEDTLGKHEVFGTATAYRRAVDEALFGLGTERYEALVNLLIQLRQPQLSKRPDEKLLSKALTEALPPLEEGMVGEVAEAFRGLDEERTALAALSEAEEAAATFLSHYRRYARVAAKRTAAGVRLAHSKYEHLNKDLKTADEDHESAQREFDAVEREIAGLEQQAARLVARHDALNRDPAMDTAREIDRLEQVATTLRRAAEDRARLSGQAERDAASREAKAQDARSRARIDETAADDAESAAAGHAGDAGIDHPRVRAAGDMAAMEAAGRLAAQTRAQAVTGLEALVAVAEKARDRLRSARQAAERAAQDATAARERAQAAAAEVTREGTALVDGYRAWSATASELMLPAPDELLGRLEAWVETLDGPNPAAADADEARAARAAILTRAETELDARTADARTRFSALEAEVTRLESGGHDAPPAPYFRADGARGDRPGAPLWRVVDFADGVGERERAGIEAALEAAGILDAWLTPDGSLVGTDGEIVVSGVERAAGPNLAAVLRPAVDRADTRAAALEDAAVTAVLSAIGLGANAHTTWVTLDGGFRNGVLSGRWTKPEARFIGEGSREAARRARLAELAAQISEINKLLDGLAAQRESLHARGAVLAAEFRARPADSALRDAHSKAASAEDAARRAVERSEEAESEARDRAEAVRSAEQEAAEYARDTALPLDAEALRGVRDAVTAYREALAALWPAVRVHRRTLSEAAEAETESEAARERLTEATEAAQEAAYSALAAAEEHRTLLETSGAEVAELNRRLAEVRGEQEACKTTLKDAAGRRDDAFGARERAEGKRLHLRVAIDESVVERSRAIEALRAFTATGLLAAALDGLETPPPAEPWAPTPAVAVARAIDQELGEISSDDRRWELVQQRVSAEHKVLTDALGRHGHSVGMTLHDTVMVVDVLFQGRSMDVPSLAAALKDEVEQRGRLLSARERELLENHLVGEVAGALQELVAAAERQVLAMNQDLDARPTSTGMRLRLLWGPSKDAPEGLEAVRQRLLRKSSDAWSPADRALVGEFLQHRIRAERAEHPSDSWHDQLVRALDYRVWHAFKIERKQDGQWKPAAGPASGGERVLAASVPLFAAASSHYSSGSPHAPRLIALDEAFAGVDDDSRAKCLGLLASFDLDVVMTSEREWACYPTVPGIAIAQLARREGIDAVLVTPWRWDGTRRERLQRPEPFVPSATRAEAAEAPALFG